VVPPPNLVLAIIAGLVLARRRRRSGLIIVAASLGLLFILSLPIVSRLLIVSLEQGLPLNPPRNDPPQAIIVLSAEMVHTVGGELDVQVGPLTLQRLRAAAALQRRTHLPILVSGGTLETDEPPIAALMADSLKTDFGVPVQWVEARSRNTWENASDSAAILEPLGIRSVYVVTHAWHEHRAMIAFRRTKLRATAAPVQLDGLSAGAFPEAGAWLQSYYALHEWIGLAWYWLADQLWRSNSAA
jgi:uncharacterized SAM-binding protein YcdF (DUF218 family)